MQAVWKNIELVKNRWKTIKNWLPEKKNLIQNFISIKKSYDLLDEKESSTFLRRIRNNSQKRGEVNAKKALVSSGIEVTSYSE